MGAAKHLPIWKDAQRLVKMLHETTRKAPRDLRHTLVQRLLTEAIELLVDIDTANRTSGAQRLDHIRQAQQRIVRVDVLLQVATDQRCLSLGAAAQAIEKIDVLGRQAHGWAASTTKTLATTGPPEPELST